MISVSRSLAWWIAAVAVIIAADRFAPVSIWFEVGKIEVMDADQGTAPVMHVERTINYPFFGHWSVELEREGQNGGFVYVTRASGENKYAKDARLPDPLNMDWWTYPMQLRPEPGRYRLETCWTVVPLTFSPKRLCVQSNTFTIRGKSHEKSHE